MRFLTYRAATALSIVVLGVSTFASAVSVGGLGAWTASQQRRDLLRIFSGGKMFKGRHFCLSVIVLTACLGSSPVYSIPVEGSFSGLMNGSFVDYAGVFGPIGTTIQGPEPITGSFHYDTDYVGLQTSTAPGYAKYYIDDSNWLSISISINGTTVDLRHTNLSNPYGTRSSIALNHTSYDQLGVGMGSYCTLCNITYFNFNINLSSSDYFLSSTDLPTYLNYSSYNFPNSYGTIDFMIDSSGNALSTTSNYIILNQLSINSVPVPAAAWLFSSGLLGLIGMAKRKAA